MKGQKTLFSKNTDNWKTPLKIYNYFIKKLGCIDCFKYESEENELNNNYENKKLFINPPFSKMKEITPWIIEQTKKNDIYLLIPARTDTKYFHDLLKQNPEIVFIKGRLHYNDSKSAPFPTLLLKFTKYNFGKLPLYECKEQSQIEYEKTTKSNP